MIVNPRPSDRIFLSGIYANIQNYEKIHNSGISGNNIFVIHVKKKTSVSWESVLSNNFTESLY